MKVRVLGSSAFAGIALVASSLFASSCGQSTTAPTTYAAFTKIDLVIGTGAEVVTGVQLTINYTGWLYDASKPDSKGAMFATTQNGNTYTITLGQGSVIDGWEQGIPGMKVGGLRRLIIPPSMAYGGSRNGPIPPNATLLFEIELVSVAGS